MIRNVKMEDLNELDSIYKELYDDADIGEYWTIENAKKLLKYWYDKQEYKYVIGFTYNSITGKLSNINFPFYFTKKYNNIIQIIYYYYTAKVLIN